MNLSLPNGLDRKESPPQRRDSNTQDSKQQFLEAMHNSSIAFQGPLISDGVIHRIRVGQKKRKDGWYVFFGLAGAFGDWSRDI